MGNIWLSIFVESNWLVCFHRLQPEEMTRLRSLNRQLQIDIDCTLKETDLLQSRGMQTHTHKCTFLQIKLWSVSLIYFKALILKEPRPEADRLGSKVMDESPSHCIQMQRSKTTGRSITGPVTGLTLIGPLHSVWLVLVNYVIANSIACLNKLHCFTYFPGIVFFEAETLMSVSNFLAICPVLLNIWAVVLLENSWSIVLLCFSLQTPVKIPCMQVALNTGFVFATLHESTNVVAPGLLFSEPLNAGFPSSVPFLHSPFRSLPAVSMNLQQEKLLQNIWNFWSAPDFHAFIGRQ